MEQQPATVTRSEPDGASQRYEGTVQEANGQIDDPTQPPLHAEMPVHDREIEDASPPSGRLELPDPLFEDHDLHDHEEEDAGDLLMPLAAPVVKRKIRGMGTVYDWRATTLLPPNGGRIKPLVFVQHIPVFPNKPGVEDFLGLAGVLRRQGLSLHCATDRDGNVALYNRMDDLCYQARGANQVSVGCEHMHMTTSEPWTKKQLRAAAWLAWRAYRDYGIPLQMAALDAGPRFVVVRRRGHTSHQEVSAKAGYHDRSDPGALFDWQYLFHCCNHYARHGHFQGA